MDTYYLDLPDLVDGFDIVLAAQYQSGGVEEFVEQSRRHLYRRPLHGMDADDVHSMTVLNVSKRASVVAKEAARVFFLTALYNTWKDERRRWSQQFVPASQVYGDTPLWHLPSDYGVGQSGYGPEEAVVLRDSVAFVLAHIQDDHVREAVRLRFEGYTHQEIASIQGSTVKKAGRRSREGISRLRELQESLERKIWG